MTARLAGGASILALALAVGAAPAFAQTSPGTPGTNGLGTATTDATSQGATSQGSTALSTSTESQGTASQGMNAQRNGPISGALGAATQSQGTANEGSTGAAGPRTNQSQAQTPQGRRAEQFVQHEVQDLQRRLHITPQQQQQWDQFVSTMRQNAEDIDNFWAQHEPELGSMNAEQSLQFYAQMMQTYAQHAQRLQQPFDQLYASLSDQQKQAADEAFRQMRQNQERRHRGGPHRQG